MKCLILTSLIGFLLVLSIVPVEVNATDSSASEQPLCSLVQAKGLSIGAAVKYQPLEYDSQYSEVLAQEFNMLTVMNMMKFSFIHPEQNEYDFARADAIVDFAEQNGMKVRGHCLVWHNALPSWLTEGNWSRDELIAILQDHIKTVVGHYCGRVAAWDVINEAFTGYGTLRDTFWLQGIGPEYISMVFRWAHEADPNALLFYNDFGGEGLGKKSTAIYNMAKELLQDGVPIDGIGLQMHVSLDFYPKPEDVAANMERFAGLGLEIHVTEMTVVLYDPVTQEDLDKQADIYRDILEVCLSVNACKAFVMWGFTDLYSYYKTRYTDRGSALIFNESYQAKPAYDALVEVLKPEKSFYFLSS